MSVSVCGEMAGDPVVAPVLVGLGLSELSMSAVAIPEVKAVLRATSKVELEALCEKLLRLPTAMDIRDTVAGYLVAQGITVDPD